MGDTQLFKVQSVPSQGELTAACTFFTVLNVGLFPEHSMTYMYLACWTFLCFPSPGHVEEKSLKLPYQVCHGYDGRHPTFQGAIRPKPRRTNSRLPFLTVLNVGLFSEHSIYDYICTFPVGHSCAFLRQNMSKKSR